MREFVGPEQVKEPPLSRKDELQVGPSTASELDIAQSRGPQRIRIVDQQHDTVARRIQRRERLEAEFQELVVLDARGGLPKGLSHQHRKAQALRKRPLCPEHPAALRAQAFCRRLKQAMSVIAPDKQRDVVPGENRI